MSRLQPTCVLDCIAQKNKRCKSNVLLVVGIARSGLQLGEEFLLLGGDTSLALFQREFLRVPALLLDLGGVLRRLLFLGVGADGFMGFLVHRFDLKCKVLIYLYRVTVIQDYYGIGNDAVLDELRELLLVGLFIFVHQLTHVIGNVQAHDVFAVNLGVEIL